MRLYRFFIQSNSRIRNFGLLLYLVNLLITLQSIISSVNYNLIRYKHKLILDFLKVTLLPLISIEKKKQKDDTMSSPIWVCWLQGKHKMPTLVKICYSSICKHSNGHKVILLTLDNYEKYCNIPNNIVEAYKNGKIQHCHFADIMRTCLLYENGGLWIDATILVTKDIPEWIFHKKFYSCKFHDANRPDISKCQWSVFLLGAQPNSATFSFLRQCFFNYLSMYIEFIDYFLMDYCIRLGYENVEEVRKEIESLPFNNEGIYDLARVINKPATSEQFYKLMNSETFFYKLNWKLPLFESINGIPTTWKLLKEQYETI